MKIFLSLILIFLVGCPKILPVWDGKIYRSRPDICSIRRNVDGVETVISCCDTEAFKGFYCLSEDDLIDLMDIINKCCARWKQECL